MRLFELKFAGIVNKKTLAILAYRRANFGVPQEAQICKGSRGCSAEKRMLARGKEAAIRLRGTTMRKSR